MNNTIVSSPNVMGNIGSCSSQNTQIETGRTFWKLNIKNIVTNSCTGETMEFDSWETSGSAVLTGVFVLFSHRNSLFYLDR